MHTLVDLSPGQQASIAEITAPLAIRQRMFDMGLLPDVRINLQRVGPTGHPIWIKCQGVELALRLSEAGAILIKDVTP